ncbi:MAG TPA: Hpt domain-containing protein, partial [Burkholderiaceae bacterium]|nr:Hpt domain-containing protein [Burkholderiaceae bacterium]
MGDMTTEGSQVSTGLDLSQFYQVFFEEAGENLDRMEQLLLELDIEAADDEELNAIFRCAHSIKGGAATFGFADVAELTHQMETLLDKLRRHELGITPAMVDVLLASGDALRAQLARHQNGQGDEVDTTELLFNIRAMVAGEAPPAAAPAPVQAPAPAPAAPARPEPPPASVPVAGTRVLDLEVGPLSDPAQADNLLDLFREIAGLGTMEPLDGGQAMQGIRRFRVVTSSSESELLDLFTFHVSREQVRFKPVVEAGAPPAP